MLTNLFSSVESVLVIALLLTPVISCLLITLLKRKQIIETTTVISSLLILSQGLFLLPYILEKKTISIFDGTFYLDSLSAIMIITISLVGFLASLYSVNYMGRQYDKLIVDGKKLVRYYQGFNMFLFTMLLVPVSNNLGIMWIAIEATTLVSVLLIMLYTKQSSIEASWKYLLIATVGLSLALFGIIFFYYANSVYDGSFDSTHGMDWTNMVENAPHFDPNLVKFAFSSIEHMGLISVSVGFGIFLGIYGALLHVINHAVVKSLLFFSSGTISQKYQTKSIADTSGIIKTMPITGFMFLIGGLAIIGMPPFNIFMSEFLMLSSGFSS